MGRELYSVEQVAGLLGLHVKTVRGYVRDGRLRAVRIGKQYRIARGDLEEFTGGPAPVSPRESARRTRHTEVTCVVQIDAIDFATMSRVGTYLTAAAGARPDATDRVHIQTTYDEERAGMKIVLLGAPADTAEFLKLIDMITGEGS